MSNVYNGKLYFTCDMCGLDHKIVRYLHRIHFDELDSEEFHPRATLGVQVCASCMEKVKDFVFGNPEKEIRVSRRPSDDWETYLKIKREGKWESYVKALGVEKEKTNEIN